MGQYYDLDYDINDHDTGVLKVVLLNHLVHERMKTTLTAYSDRCRITLP